MVVHNNKLYQNSQFYLTMLGSLQDFLQMEDIPNQSKIQLITSLQQLEQQTEANNIKNNPSIHKQLLLRQSRKNKIRLGNNDKQYSASNKKELLKLFQHNYPGEVQKYTKKNLIQLKTNKESISQGFEKESDYLTGRKSILNKSKRGVSLFDSNNHKFSSEKQDSDDMERSSQVKLKREQNLLRAIARTKAKNMEEAPITEYQQSYNRIVHKVEKIKIKPNTIELDKDKKKEKYGEDMLTLEQIQKQIQGELIPYSSRSLQKNGSRGESPAQDQNRVKQRQLSKYQRIEFENCLSWSRKHNQNGQFYRQMLGKNGKQALQENKRRANSSFGYTPKKYFQKDTQAQQLLDKRKQIMGRVYHQRSFSNAIN